MSNGSIIVSGGGRGIGLSVVQALLSAGRKVVAFDLDASGLERHPRLTIVEGDASSEVDVQRACTAAGEIGGVVACAGISRPGATVDYSLESWERLLQVNLTSVFLLFRCAVARARPGASFVAISSISGLQGFSGRAAYSASKAGVDALVRTCAVEFAPAVRVNAIAPGYIMTDLVRTNLSLGVITERSILDRTPLGRWGRPEDVASTASFLLSDEAGFITGTTVVVDGGWMSFGLGAGGDA